MNGTLPSLAPGSGPATGASDPRVGRLREAARSFESMAVAQMLQPMFATVDLSKGPFGGRQGEAMWRPLMVEEMAKTIARAGGFGIADAVFREMLRTQEQQAAGAAAALPGTPAGRKR
jgi:peptidoglycan hydrolase FlgJ